MSNYEYASEKCEETLRILSTSENIEDRLVNALSELKVTTENDYLGDEKETFLKFKSLDANRLKVDEMENLAKSIVDFCVRVIRIDENAQAISDMDEE